MKKDSLGMSGERGERSQVARRLQQHPLPRAAGDTRSLRSAASPLWEHFQAALLMRDQNQLTAGAEGEPRAHSSGEGHQEKLQPCLRAFLPRTAGSRDAEILTPQHLDIK